VAPFPDTEPEIAALAMVLIRGLRGIGAELPAPPVSADELQAKLDAYTTTAKAAVAASSRGVGCGRLAAWVG
jgi:hypothetical protein